MKQILQSLKTGATQVAEVPVPRVGRGQLLIATSHTLVSAGTERMLVEFGKGGLLAKAKAQPDKVRLVIDKVKTDGLISTIKSVMNRLDEPLSLGYCNVGSVIQAEGLSLKAQGLKMGDLSIPPWAESVKYTALH